MNSWIAIVGVLLVLGFALGALRAVQVRLKWHPEVVRKALHMAMGLVVLAFPLLFQDVMPVLVLGVVSTGLMAVVRRMSSTSRSALVSRSVVVALMGGTPACGVST